MRQLEESFIFKVIRDRRSVREFEEMPVEDDAILSILEAARWAPSGGNRQPLIYVVVTKSGLKAKVKAVSPGLSGDPAALVAICIDKGVGQSAEMSESQTGTQRIEVGMAAQNLILQAQDLGLGTCAIRSFNAKAVSRLLTIPDDVVPELIVTLGYAKRTPEAPPRRPLEDIVHWDCYGTERIK